MICSGLTCSLSASTATPCRRVCNSLKGGWIFRTRWGDKLEMRLNCLYIFLLAVKPIFLHWFRWLRNARLLWFIFLGCYISYSVLFERVFRLHSDFWDHSRGFQRKVLNRRTHGAVEMARPVVHAWGPKCRSLPPCICQALCPVPMTFTGRGNQGNEDRHCLQRLLASELGPRAELQTELDSLSQRRVIKKILSVSICPLHTCACRDTYLQYAPPCMHI